MPEMSLEKMGLASDEAGRVGSNVGGALNDVAEAVRIEAKYEGYLTRQTAQVERLKDLENRIIPKGWIINQWADCRVRRLKN